MSVTESKVRRGTFKLGPTASAKDFSGQLTNIRITPSADTSGDPVEVLSGDVLGVDTTTSFVLNGTLIQDFSDDAGLVAYSWENDLVDTEFTWEPVGATGPSFAGTVQVQAIETGGDVNSRITSDIAWPIVGTPVRTNPSGAKKSALASTD